MAILSRLRCVHRVSFKHCQKKSCVGQNSDTSAFFTLSQRNNYFAGNTPNKRQRFLSAIKLSSHQWLIFGQLITRMKYSIFSSLKTIVQWSPLSALCGQHRINSYLAGKKMAAILADDTLKCIFLNKNDRIPFRISLKFVPMSPVDNKPALVQVMAWRRTGDKPLPEPMITQFTDAYMRH